MSRAGCGPTQPQSIMVGQRAASQEEREVKGAITKTENASAGGGSSCWLTQYINNLIKKEVTSTILRIFQCHEFWKEKSPK